MSNLNELYPLTSETPSVTFDYVKYFDIKAFIDSGRAGINYSDYILLKENVSPINMISNVADGCNRLPVNDVKNGEFYPFL